MKPRFLAASIHDIAPATFDHVRPIAALLDELGVRPINLLVIPQHHNSAPLLETPSLVDWLRARQAEGDEILQHGCEHRLIRRPASRLEALHIRALSRGEGEFANLDEAEAGARLRRGRKILEACGLRASGFVAPGYLLSLPARRAVAAAGFSHVPQLFSLWEPPRGRTRFAPAIFFDPHTALIRRLTFAYSSLALQVLARHPILRVAIHPPDLRDPRTAAALRAALTVALRTRTPTTYTSLACQ